VKIVQKNTTYTQIGGLQMIGSEKKLSLSFIIIAAIIITILAGCKKNENPPVGGQDTALNTEPAVVSAAPQITREEVFAVLNNQDSSIAKRAFSFETAAYKAKGSWIGTGKYEVGIKGNGTIALTLSSSKNVVINQTEKRISIAFGQTFVEATTDLPDKWTYFAVKESDQEKVEKNKADFIDAMEKKTGDTGWDKETIANITNEIADQRNIKSAEEKASFEDNIRSSITNQLTQRYQINDYAIEIFFD
jgi:hypothetical protein